MPFELRSGKVPRIACGLSIARSAGSRMRRSRAVGDDARSMARGTVRWFSDANGYDFITPDRGGSEVFVHYTRIADGGFRTLIPQRLALPSEST